MQFSIELLILVGAIVVLLGLVAMGLMNALGSEGDPEPEGGESAPPGGKKGRYQPVARLWRERGSGRLIVEMDGKSYLTTERLDDAQRRRLAKTWADFGAWLGVSPDESHDAPPEDKAAVEPPRVDSAAPAEATVSTAPAASAAPYAPVPSAAPAAGAAAVPYASPLVDSAAAQPEASAQPARPAAVPRGASPAVQISAGKSIVEQIDEILQEMLPGTPLVNRGIHLSEDPVRGVIVQVGLEFYEGIESVPDPEIKKILREAAATWERMQ